MEEQLEKEQYLNRVFSALNIELSKEQTGRFLRYAELLEEGNKVMNLTAITEFRDVAEKHFADSCAIELIPEGKELDRLRMIDVGTGAGFPGIPLKILHPEMRITLLDSLGKRVHFLENTLKELELKGAEAVHARAEDAARLPEYREQFDLCVSRAVASLAVLCEYTLPYIRVGGCLAAYKSGDVEAETAAAANAVRILGGGRPEIRRFTLPGTDLGRSIVIIRKERHTPGKYPRKAGTAAKAPLI